MKLVNGWILMNSKNSWDYKLILLAKAQKYLNKFDAATSGYIINQLDTLRLNPYEARNAKPLKGELKGKYSFRMGSFRAIYEVDQQGYIILVLIIGPRGDVYK